MAKVAAKPGRKPAKRKKAAPGTSATLKLFGRTYKKVACGLSKTDATGQAVAHRAKGKGKGAAVKKNSAGSGYCLYKRG